MNEWITAVKLTQKSHLSMHPKHTVPAWDLQYKQEHTVQSCRIQMSRTFTLHTNFFQLKKNFSDWYVGKNKITHTHTQLTIPSRQPLPHIHPSSPTSFPRQDLKTSIAIEFIKVAWWIVCAWVAWGVVSASLSSDLIISLCGCGVFFLSVCYPAPPVCSSSFIKTRIQIQLWLPASSTLISDSDAQREEREEGWSVLPTSVRACLPFFPKTFLSPPFLPPLLLLPLPEVTVL